MKTLQEQVETIIETKFGSAWESKTVGDPVKAILSLIEKEKRKERMRINTLHNKWHKFGEPEECGGIGFCGIYWLLQELEQTPIKEGQGE